MDQSAGTVVLSCMARLAIFIEFACTILMKEGLQAGVDEYRRNTIFQFGNEAGEATAA